MPSIKVHANNADPARKKANWDRVTGLVRDFNVYVQGMKGRHPKTVAALEKKLDESQHKVFMRKHNLKFGIRGNRKYFPIHGWVKFAIKTNQHVLKTWPVAYHGTRLDRALGIAAHGFRPPAAGGKIAHGHAGGNRSTTYVTPVLGYAALPVYSPIQRLSGSGRRAQFVVQVRVRPGSYVRQDNTLKRKHWDLRLSFDEKQRTHRDIEWLVNSPSDIAVCGILVRELGRRASRRVFGSLPKKVRGNFHLSSLLQKSFRARRLRRKDK